MGTELHILVDITISMPHDETETDAGDDLGFGLWFGLWFGA